MSEIPEGHVPTAISSHVSCRNSFVSRWGVGESMVFCVTRMIRVGWITSVDIFSLYLTGYKFSFLALCLLLSVIWQGKYLPAIMLQIPILSTVNNIFSESVLGCSSWILMDNHTEHDSVENWGHWMFAMHLRRAVPRSLVKSCLLWLIAMCKGEVVLASWRVFFKERQYFPPHPRGERQEKAKGLMCTALVAPSSYLHDGFLVSFTIR